MTLIGVQQSGPGSDTAELHEIGDKFTSHSLRAFTDKGLDWLSTNLDQFDPSEGRTRSDTHREKALAELAILCVYLARIPLDSKGARLLREFLAFIASIFDRPVFQERLFRVDNEFVHIVYLAVALRTAGLLDDPHLWSSIQGLLSKGNVCVSERPPHRISELRRLLDRGGFSYVLPSYEQLCRWSILNKPLNVVHLTDYDIYSITHNLFYLTDMGSYPLIGISRHKIRELQRAIDDLLGAQTRRGNWDLVGELLLSARLLAHTNSLSYRLGWETMVRAQQDDGAVPGLDYDLRHLGQLDAPERRLSIFKDCYHTTLVAVLAGALCLNSVDESC